MDDISKDEVNLKVNKSLSKQLEGNFESSKLKKSCSTMYGLHNIIFPS